MSSFSGNLRRSDASLTRHAFTRTSERWGGFLLQKKLHLIEEHKSRLEDSCRTCVKVRIRCWIVSEGPQKTGILLTSILTTTSKKSC